MFILQENPIDSSQARNMCRNSANGAVVIFEGMVRADEQQNHTVSELLYIADNASVLAEGEKIIKEALSKFSITEAVCIQRVGQLKTTETAVWIGVWAPTGMKLLKAAATSSKKSKKDCSSGKKNFTPMAPLRGSRKPQNLLSPDMKIHSPALLSDLHHFSIRRALPLFSRMRHTG